LVTGAADAPAKAGLPVADIAAGMYTYSNVLAALMQRARDGRGRRSEVSMVEALGEWMGFPMYYAFGGADGPPRSGAAHPTIAPYGPYPVGDGGSVMLGAQNEREWRRLCEQVLERPGLADDPRFADNGLRNQQRALLHGLIADAFAGLDTAEVVRRLDRSGIANAQVNAMRGLWAHAQLRARERLTQVDSPAGSLPALWPPGQRAGDARMQAVPGLGQHTDSILAELGLSAGEIAALRAAGAV